MLFCDKTSKPLDIARVPPGSARVVGTVHGCGQSAHVLGVRTAETGSERYQKAACPSTVLNGAAQGMPGISRAAESSPFSLALTKTQAGKKLGCTGQV